MGQDKDTHAVSIFAGEHNKSQFWEGGGGVAGMVELRNTHPCMVGSCGARAGPTTTTPRLQPLRDQFTVFHR